jgi:hypothetical protein
MLLSHGGGVQMLAGIPVSSSDFSPPEQSYHLHSNDDQANVEKVKVFISAWQYVIMYWHAVLHLLSGDDLAGCYAK